VPNQDQRQAKLATLLMHASGFIHHGGQIVEQGGIVRQAAARTARQTVAALVIRAYGKAPVAQFSGQWGVSPRVFTQAVHQQHLRARRARWRRPVIQHQGLAVSRGQRTQGGGRQAHQPGICAITCATAAVSFLA
jgi:hypothetical protein